MNNLISNYKRILEVLRKILKEQVLSKGNTMDYEEMYKTFAGRDPKAEPMLKARGLK